VIGKPELTPKFERNKLRLLLLGEIGDNSHSHARLENAAAMWDKSRQLDDTLLFIWKADKEKIRRELGEKEYKAMDEMLNTWLVIRRMARMLGELAGRHPMDGKPVPRYTFEQWVENLGSVSQYEEMDYELTRYRMELEACRMYEMSPDVVAETLAKAFETLAQYPNALKVFKSGIIKFNGKLFSWRLDFWS
jgi:hypothetical protein